MMRIVVLPTAEQAAVGVARFVARAVADRPDTVLGLPTGRTMVRVYDALVRMYERGDVRFRRVTTFNLDEFIGLRPRHSGRYRAFMERYFFGAVDLRPGAAQFPSGGHEGGRRYDAAIARAGGLDLCVLGIGTNGHLGFNEPGPSLSAATHRVRLLPATRRANAYLFARGLPEVPRAAMSMGIATILNARTVVLLATGADKATIVRRALTGPITTRVPASLLQVHPNALVVLDRPAAGRLSRRAAR